MPIKITVPESEYWDEIANKFYSIKGATLTLEHSLVSISKWEQNWNKPFLDDRKKKSPEEMFDYIRCMTLTQNVDPLIYYAISTEQFKEIKEYMDAPMTATTISDMERTRSRKIITAEVVYYWMIECGIWKECEKWHFNRLITLIKVCGAERSTKKMPKNEMLAKRRRLNAQRRKRLGSKG